MTRSIATQSRMIRIPVHVAEALQRVSRMSRSLAQHIGREPTPEEIAQEVELSTERVRELLTMTEEPVSLEAPIGDDGEASIGDFIEDRHAPSPAQAATTILLQEQVEQLLTGLSTREQQVLQLRFGLQDGSPHTLEEIGRCFHLSRERARQIEAKALAKLRHSPWSHRLRNFFTGQ